MRALDGDVEGRAGGDSYLAGTHALYHGDPTPWALTPKIFDVPTIELLRNAAETMYGIMDKITRAYRTDPELREAFGFDAGLEELCMLDSGYDCQIPLARVDIFLNEETGAFKFCELNTDGSAGMVTTDEVNRAIIQTPSWKAFSNEHPGLRSFDICDGWIDALLATYEERLANKAGDDAAGKDDSDISFACQMTAGQPTSPTAGKTDGGTTRQVPVSNIALGAENGDAADGSQASPSPAASVQTPIVAIVDYAESVDAEDVAHFIELLEQRGIMARFADVRDLKIEDDPNTGEPCLADTRGSIDCVWRRAVTGELWEKPCPGRAALIDAQRRNLACIVGGFRTWPCATKTLFALLWSDIAQRILTSSELKFVHEHVPYTERLDLASDLARFAEKDRWIVKPAGGYNSVGVVAGLDATPEKWARTLEHAARGGGIVQEYAPQYATPCLRGTLIDGPHRGAPDPATTDELGFAPALNMEGLYLFRGKFAGIYTRAGFANTIGEWSSRLNVGCFYADE